MGNVSSRDFLKIYLVPIKFLSKWLRTKHERNTFRDNYSTFSEPLFFVLLDTYKDDFFHGGLIYFPN